jgi:general secretion pathway protein K
LLRQSDQAFWYALGAEELAAAVITQSHRISPDRDSLQSPWAQGEQIFPITGGHIRGGIIDGGNCFNINGLVSDMGGRLVIDSLAAEELARLLDHLDVDEAQAARLIARFGDWIDSDQRVSPRGAEDFAYGGKDIGYRTADSLMVEGMEMRAVEGMDAGLYRALRDWLCVLPMAGPSVININTLSLSQWPLLAMIFGDRFTESQLRGLILDRPEGGYRGQGSFWAQPLFGSMVIPTEMQQRIGVKTRFFLIRSTILLDSRSLALQTLFEKAANGRLIRHRRQIGQDL